MHDRIRLDSIRHNNKKPNIIRFVKILKLYNVWYNII